MGITCRRVYALFATVLFSSFISSARADVHISRGATEGRLVSLSAGSPGISVLWDLNGDGKYERHGRRLRVVFSDSGKRRIHVRELHASRSRRISTRTTTHWIRIGNARPSSNFSMPRHGWVGQPVAMVAKIHDAGMADMRRGFLYEWSFDDGTKAIRSTRAANIEHTFHRAGRHSVRLRARDKDGAWSSSLRRTLTIFAAPPAAATPMPTASTPAAPVPSPAALTRVRPEEISDLLANPDIGWQSGDRVVSAGVDAKGFPISVAYVKYYWRDLEPQDGRFDFSLLNRHLEQARAAGQKLAFRVVAVDNLTSGPTWLRSLGARGTVFQDPADNGGGGPTLWAPDFNDALVQKKHLQLLQALAGRYDGDPALSSIDIGTVGLWGEWHFWGTSPSVAMPTVASRKIVIDQYFSTFSVTPKVAQLQDREGLRYAVARGAGFRGDCLGNMDNQMKGQYEPNIAYAGASNAWRTAPVLFESCWNATTWVSKGWDVNAIVSWALQHHISALNNKNNPAPSSVFNTMKELQRRMGYRIVLREIRHPQRILHGAPLPISIDWENVGVAPSYADYRVAIQIRSSKGEVVATHYSTTSIKGFLPGLGSNDFVVSLPTLTPGTYRVAIALVEPDTRRPAVRFATAGREASGWYPLSSFVVQ